MKKALLFIVSFLLIISLFKSNSLIAKEGQFLFQSKNDAIAGEPLTKYATLWGWGYNPHHELGDGTNLSVRWRPIQIDTDKWNMVAGGASYTLGLKSDSSLWAWGGNNVGQYGNRDFDTSHIPLKIGTEKSWKFVAVGLYTSYGIKSDGSLWAWGWNEYGQIGDSTTWAKIEPVRIGKNILGPVRFVSGGMDFVGVITNDGSLWTWGSNRYGQLGDATSTDSHYPIKIGNSGEWRTISCGNMHAIAIKTDGTLWAWGYNKKGDLGDGTYISKNQPTKIGNDCDWETVSCEVGVNLAIKTDGTLWAWGTNYNGELGDGTTIAKNTPTQVGTDKDWALVSSRLKFSEAVKKDGTLWYWGQILDWNSLSYVTILVPTKMENISNVIQLSRGGGGGFCGGSQSLFIRDYLALPAKIETTPVSNITSSTAISGGKITSSGTEIIYQRGICYDIRTNPSLYHYTTQDGKDMGEFKSKLTKLRPYTKYYVRAYVTTAAGESYGQVERLFTKLTTPVLLTPENGEVEVPVKKSFVWKKVENALGYRFQLSKYQNFIINVYDTELADTNIINLGLDLNIEYFWRVEAIHSPYTSDWSDTSSFFTIKFYVQKLNSPADNSINIPIDCQLNWVQNTSSSLYRLQVSKSNDFTDLTIDTILNQNDFKCDKLDFFCTFNWRVKSFFITDSSAWSAVWRFTTFMDTVNLIAPADLSSNLDRNLNVNWDNANYYKNSRLQMAKGNSFIDIIVDSLIIMKNNADIKNLKNSANYIWRVRKESGDTLGYWSKSRQFRTKMTYPILLYPPNKQTGLEQIIKFEWSFVIGGKYYQLQISKNDQFTDLVYSEDSITATEKLVPDLEPDILYYWRVRVWNEESIGSAIWSEVWTFKTTSSRVIDGSEFIRIIPNPAGDFITIILGAINPMLQHGVANDNSQIRIYNTLGEKVMSVEQTFLSVQQINISALPKGMYFVKAGGAMAKFVKI